MGSAQVLAVWGAPGTGKTATAVKLALELAAHRKNTIILMCDFSSPAPQTLQPNVSTEGKSLGSLLTLPSISQDAILAHCIPFGNNPYIYLLGYQRGDNPFTYPQFAKERAVDLITMLGHLADYVLIDVSSAFSFDALSAVALENADAVLRLCTCDLKSMSYMSANLPLLADGRFASNRHIRILSMVKPGQDSGEYDNTYGGAAYTLPFVPELEGQFYSARLMDRLCTMGSKKYNAAIRKIARDLLLDVMEKAPVVKNKPSFSRKEKLKKPVFKRAGATFAEFRKSSDKEKKPKKTKRLFAKKKPEDNLPHSKAKGCSEGSIFRKTFRKSGELDSGKVKENGGVSRFLRGGRK